MITVTAKPTASYSAPASVCLGDTIHFLNSSTGNGSTITGYTWNFGDGSPSSSYSLPILHLLNLHITLTQTHRLNSETQINSTLPNLEFTDSPKDIIMDLH